ncbi:MAG: SprB repeat-containing protein, partial [Bacteroidia bacterium]
MKQRYFIFFFLLFCLFIFPKATDAQNKSVTKTVNSNDKSLLGTCAYCNYGQQKMISHPPTPLDGNNALGNIYDNTACGLNYVYGSVKITQRYATPAGSGNPATIAISGIPAGCTVIDKAYLWYIASYTEGAAPASTIKFTNPAPATATYASTIIGTGPSKCWGETGTATYRADVTAAISGNGNYGINITGFANASSEIDGAALIIIYKNTAAPYQGTMVIADGCLVNSGGPDNAYTLGGFTACAASATASAFVVTSDMQDNVNGGTHTSTLNGNTATYGNNFFNFDNAATTVTSGQTTSPFSTADPGDCYAWALVGLYYQTTCVVCTTPTLTLTMSSTPASCGNSNGTATVSAAGGTAPYTYSWSPGGQTTATATGLSAGSYTVTVKDASGCNTATSTVIVASSGGITATATFTPISCNGGNNGTATATPAGGTGPYTYSWNSSGQTTQTATGLSAASYTVTVKDANGCTASVAVTPTQPTVLSATTTNTAVSCSGGSNGTAKVTAAGGTGLYTYSWNPSGQTTQTATGLATTSYTVTVKDANGCTTTTTVNITQPAAITLTTTTTTAHCGQADGGASVSATGGTGVYTYSWSNGVTIASNANIVSGTYTVTVTDGNGCTQTATALVPNSGGITSAALTSTNSTCGNTNGTATVTGVTGGAPAYTYSWAGGQTTSTITGQPAGTYSVTITDANGCKYPTTVVINNTPGVNATMGTATNTSCFAGNNGSATVTASSGTNPYTYSWTGGQSTATATGLAAGNYTVTVTDASGCTATVTTVITQPTKLDTTTNYVNELCNGGNNGAATINVTGGTGAYTYIWTPNVSSTGTATALAAGTYAVTVNDANGCSISKTFTINQPTTIVLTTTTTTAHCGQADGDASASATGGIGAYNYSWSNGITTANNANIINATYTVTVTDANGCTQTATAIVPNSGGPSSTITTVTNVSCFGMSNGSITVNAAGGTGAYTYLWTPTGQTTATATGLAPGTYS